MNHKSFNQRGGLGNLSAAALAKAEARQLFGGQPRNVTVQLSQLGFHWNRRRRSFEQFFYFAGKVWSSHPPPKAL